MTQPTSKPLVAVLIRIGLLLALAIMLMAEHAQAEWQSVHFAKPFSQPAHLPAPSKHISPQA